MSLSDEEILAALGGEDEPERVVDYRVVQGASGAAFHVLDDNEARWFNENLDKYQSEYAFENVSDLQDLDRLIALELLSYRYAAWLLRGTDYDDLLFDEKAIRDHKQKIDQEVRLVKKHMGMDRKGRVSDEQQSTADFIQGLLRRAKEFGVHRDKQNARALDLMMECKKLVGLYDRCDEEERSHLGVSPEQILQWLREVAFPEFDAIDDHFRVNQRLWIKELN